MKKILLFAFTLTLLFFLTGCGNGYNLTFYDNDKKIGEISTSKPRYLKLINDPIKEGFLFTGWENEGKPFTKEDLKKINKKVDLKLVATWKQVTFKVSFKSDNGQTFDSLLVKENDTLKLPVPQKEGFKFIGWFYQDKEVKDQSQFTFTTDITLTAHFTKV